MRNRLLIIGIALVVLIGGALAVLLLVNKSPQLQNAVYKLANTNSAAANTNSTANINRNIPPSDRDTIRFAARTFTELYGSFSNQNNGSNLIEAAAYATKDFAAVLRQQAVVKQATPPATTYISVITRAYVFSFVQQTSTVATVVVSTQQQTTTGASTVTGTKDLLLDLVKVGANWQVSAAVWK